MTVFVCLGNKIVRVFRIWFKRVRIIFRMVSFIVTSVKSQIIRFGLLFDGVGSLDWIRFRLDWNRSGF